MFKNIGIEAQSLSRALREQFDLPADAAGVLVTDVQPLSPADHAGFRQGDIILEINRIKIKDIKDYEDTLNKAMKQDTSILFLINRSGQNLFLPLQMKE